MEQYLAKCSLYTTYSVRPSSKASVTQNLRSQPVLSVDKYTELPQATSLNTMSSKVSHIFSTGTPGHKFRCILHYGQWFSCYRPVLETSTELHKGDNKR